MLSDAAPKLVLFLWLTLPAFSQIVELREAPEVALPSRADSNSPAFWKDGELHLLTATGDPVLSFGPNQFSLGNSQPVHVSPHDHLPIWFESTWQDEDGTVYAWYHHEPPGLCGGKLTAPKIGAAVSTDGGATFTDLGVVLESGDPIDCSAQNGFFAGGHGDFSVILDRTQTYFYFLFDNYGGAPASQGIAIARMAFSDRGNPTGMVWKYHNGDWSEPGLGGTVTPIFPVAVPWQDAGTNAFWGPSVHWNTYLKAYIVLMNHTCCKPGWPQEGIYVTLNPDLSNPGNFIPPSKLMGKVDYDAGYYPQVIGMAEGESDTLAGKVSRLYIDGRSLWEIEFWNLEDLPPEPAEPEGPVDRP